RDWLKVKSMLEVRASLGQPTNRVPSVNWRNTGFFIAVHLLAVPAFLPWFFSWTGVVLCVLGIFVFGVLGINIGYHRLLTHRGFACLIGRLPFRSVLLRAAEAV